MPVPRNGFGEQMLDESVLCGSLRWLLTVEE